MGTIVIIIIVVAALFGIGAFIFSDKGSPKDRATDAAGAAAGGAFFAGSCLFQLVIMALMALAGLWVLRLIFGH